MHHITWPGVYKFKLFSGFDESIMCLSYDFWNPATVTFKRS